MPHTSRPVNLEYFQSYVGYIRTAFKWVLRMQYKSGLYDIAYLKKRFGQSRYGKGAGVTKSTQ